MDSFAGPPKPSAVVNISKLSDTQSGATFTISWNQSDCAVQYVVTIINSSDDRVYSNITTSDTSTTVTLPTGVEFCVTLLAVDSIGRRGPDTAMPICYYYDQCEFAMTRKQDGAAAPIKAFTRRFYHWGTNASVQKHLKQLMHAAPYLKQTKSFIPARAFFLSSSASLSAARSDTVKTAIDRENISQG